MKKVLVVVDAQEDFTRGVLGTEEAIKALPIIQDIVSVANKKNMNIFYTMDTHCKQTYLSTLEGKNLPVEHCIVNTDGWRICKEVVSTDPTRTIVIEKNSFGTIKWEREYRTILSDVSEIWLCGFCTDICVSANYQTIKADYPNVPIIVIEDACAGVTPELHEAALKVMKSCQARIVKWSELKNEN